jgi:Mg-chelatase subunit ChlD
MTADRLQRWRLVLGRYAEGESALELDGDHARLDRALDFLYAREYLGRGVRPAGGEERSGGLGPSQLSLPRWLAEVRELFPKETVEVLERHALERYQLTELITDPEALARLEPSVSLLETLLHFKDRMPRRVVEEARRIVRRVTDELRQRLEQEVRRSFAGRLDRFRRSRLQVAQNLDWRATVRRNLKNWDPEARRLRVEELRFYSRIERRIPWTLILVVDQSASMEKSLIHAAVMAGIFASLPAVAVKLVVFDTSIVDLSGYVDDPVEVLLSVQLGGGTNIGQALAEGLLHDPRRSIVVLLSDFEEGASPRRLLGAVRRLREAGVRLLGLAALDEEAEPAYDRKMAERLQSVGMEIAALTPGQLARWVAEVIR